MKKGQMLSQPFFYIFAIVVIGLILIFGFRYIGKILKTGCEIETLDFVSDVQTKVNELISLSYGSSFECSIVKASGQSESRCEFVVPDNVRGLCFVDTTKTFDEADIIFSDTKQIVTVLGSDTSRNLFFSTTKGRSCKADPVKISKLTTQGAVCLDIRNRTVSLIMENTGNVVTVRKS